MITMETGDAPNFYPPVSQPEFQVSYGAPNATRIQLFVRTDGKYAAIDMDPEDAVDIIHELSRLVAITLREA